MACQRCSCLSPKSVIRLVDDDQAITIRCHKGLNLRARDREPGWRIGISEHQRSLGIHQRTNIDTEIVPQRRLGQR